jgi:hypothetical protein
LIIVNYSDRVAQALVHVPWDELRGNTWELKDVMDGINYDRSGDEMRDSGMYIELGPWKSHIFAMVKKTS